MIREEMGVGKTTTKTAMIIMIIVEEVGKTTVGREVGKTTMRFKVGKTTMKGRVG